MIAYYLSKQRQLPFRALDSKTESGPRVLLSISAGRNLRCSFEFRGGLGARGLTIPRPADSMAKFSS